MNKREMSKYIYIDGKIHIKSECFYEDLKIGAKKVIEFDSFEDLIEVGDMVRCNVDRTGIVEEVDKRKYYSVVCDSFYAIFETIVEIWKRIDNTFVKICHKENGEWRID